MFLSFDEPWAERTWGDLKRKAPRAQRVHGIKGLDASHKAAAAAVSGDWVVTVDADTTVDAALLDAPVPDHLLTGDWRLDWLSRNAVNGLWSGNGCVKLWPRPLLEMMRTHEAAPVDEMSLDHDIWRVRPGRSLNLVMPERLCQSDPARTARHAFRAGFREGVFLHHLARRASPEGADWRATEAARRLRIWACVGRHARNGLLMMYGARLGLWMMLEGTCDPRTTNDYADLEVLWQRQVRANYALGPGEDAWNWALLEEDMAALARDLAQRHAVDLPELDAARSLALSERDDLSPVSAAAAQDAMGYRLMLAARTPRDAAMARDVLEVARLLGRPAAYDNLGRWLVEHGATADATDRARHLFRAARALGNPNAAGHLAELARRGRAGKAADDGSGPCLATDHPTIRLFNAAHPPEAAAPDALWIEESNATAAIRDALGASFCLVCAPGVSLLPAAGAYVPDPDLARETDGLRFCTVEARTGRIVPDGVLFLRACDLVRSDRLPILPVVLGIRGDRLDETSPEARLVPPLPPPVLWRQAADSLRGRGDLASEEARIIDAARIAVWGAPVTGDGSGQGAP